MSGVGATFPLHCTANGKAVLATLDDEAVKALVPARLSQYTPATITRRSDLLEELAEIRRTGVALDREEHTQGISAGGFAVRDVSGTVAAISVPMPTQRFAGREGVIVAALAAASADAVAVLGARVRLGVISDVHWTETPTEASWHGPFDFSGLPARLERALEALGRTGVDAVVACGDLTHFGDEASARAVLERLPALVVAGNHDCEERDHRLEGCGARMLTAADVEGVRVTGVAIARNGADFRWTGDAAGDVVVSHFPVLSRAERLAAEGLKYAGDLANRQALRERLGHAEPVVVLSGHIHCRETHADGSVLQLSAGALIEAPHEAAIVDVSPGHVRRRVVALGGAPRPGDPALATADERWAFAGGGWRRA